jgi:hypothetical protein
MFSWIFTAVDSTASGYEVLGECDASVEQGGVKRPTGGGSRYAGCRETDEVPDSGIS